MEKFCVLANVEKDKDYETAEYVRGLIEANHRECIIVKDRFVEDSNAKKDFFDVKEIPADVECIIILGGDGTMIQAANDLYDLDIPLLGVNLGTLGFLTEVEKQNIEEALKRLYDDRYKVEKRMMLMGKAHIELSKKEDRTNEYNGLALNDFVISKDGVCRLITLHVYVNGELLDTYVADGIIVSTPTGSTGYNLSAGGPVLAPEVKAMIVTPICPHSLNKRSLVVSHHDLLEIVVGKSKENSDDEAVLITDGAITMELTTNDKLILKEADAETKIIKLTDCSFYRRLRDKLSREV